jgi:hypothetical protein
MKRLKGPQLKMPELKVPTFLTDLYWDLRDRRLLPLVALAVVGIVAVPFLLGGKSDESSSPGAVAVATPAAGGGGSGASRLVVVEAKPGLRDYHKRLGHRSPTDPFEQRFSGPQLAGSELGGEEGELSSTSTTSTSTSTTKVTETSNGSTTQITTDVTDESSGGAGAEPQLRLSSFAADIKITRSETKPDGSTETGDPTIRHRVIPPAALPSEKTQVVNYLGISPKTKKPLLLISPDVTAVYGEGKCLAGSSSCQLLEVEPTFPVTFVYGAGKVRYKVNVLKVEPVLAGKY